mmetsp:Transcript_66705/g.168269  ORF Transcript_66705/g.168269 Transcript_66705/m.168269 type:complete len:209 (-) Transcript_66705:2160-2786(-)
MRGLAQGLKRREGRLHVALLARTLDHGAVGDEVRFKALLLHLLHEPWDTFRLAVAGASIDDCIERDHRRLNVPRQHLLKDSPDALHVASPTVALQHGAEDDGVHLVATLLVIQEREHELVATINIAVGDNRLNHAADGDAGRLDVLRAHFLPAPPSTGNILDVAVCFDQAPVGVGAGDGDGLFALQLVQLVGEQGGLPDPHTSLHNRR